MYVHVYSSRHKPNRKETSVDDCTARLRSGETHVDPPLDQSALSAISAVVSHKKTTEKWANVNALDRKPDRLFTTQATDGKHSPLLLSRCHVRSNPGKKQGEQHTGIIQMGRGWGGGYPPSTFLEPTKKCLRCSLFKRNVSRFPGKKRRTSAVYHNAVPTATRRCLTAGYLRCLWRHARTFPGPLIRF